MPTIFVKDDLRRSVESASGGSMTVLYTASGQPSYMNVIQKFNLQDLDPSLGTGVCPAFIVNGVEKSELLIGAYPGIEKNGEFLSLPGVDPTTSKNHDQFVALARANGPGWHCVTNAEWAALALWCWKNGTMPRGNTNYGRSSDATHEVGRRQDRVAPGTASGLARTLTGSGPASWRHDNSHSGISDLAGNVWEWTPGIRVVGGEIQIIANNDAAALTTDFGATSSAWRAVDALTGALVAPAFTGSVAGGDYVATTANSVRLAVSGTANYTLVRSSGGTFEGMANPGASAVGAAAIQVLKAHGLYPVAATGLGGGAIYYTDGPERLAVRGGHWTYGSSAGVFALNLNGSRSYANSDVGSRPAFVL